MNHWPFIIAAYVLTSIAVAGLLGYALVRMRRAEARARELTEKK